MPNTPPVDIARGDKPAEPAKNATPRRPDRTRWFARVMLVGYVAALFAVALVGRRHGPTFQLDDLLHMQDWLGDLLVAGSLAGGRFFLLGFLLALSAGRRTIPRRFSTALGQRLLVWLLAGGLLAGLLATESGRLPGVVSFIFPLAGCLVGAWVGSAYLRGRRAMFWLMPKMVLLVLMLCVGAGGLVFLAMDDEPLSFQPEKTTSAEKRRLVKLIENCRPTGDGFQQLRLSQRDVNLLLAMAVAQTLPDGKARVVLETGTIHGDLSIKITPSITPSENSPRTDFLPSPNADAPRRKRLLGTRGNDAKQAVSVKRQYVNVRATCRAEMTAGRLEIRLTQCRVGQVSLPRFLLDAISSLVVSAILNDPDLERMIAAIDSVRVEPDGIEAVFRSRELGDKVIPSLIARLGQKPDVLTRTRIYFRHLVASADELPDDERLAAFLQTAFGLAKERSRDEDPVLENRAAILALAILLGHWRVKNLVGSVTNRDLRLVARHQVGNVTLRGREDWRKHFFVSAALALVSNELLSDEVGLFKEKLDAGEGGSGFSFSDLLADRAGTLFALAATRDQQSARRMQDRLAAGFEVDAFFPPAADLPEGISDPELQAEYGGVKGKRYNEIIQEIEQRLTHCEALR